MGKHFVVNGQKVWTSGAHDADVLLTFVRTNPDAPKHNGISALIIPTPTPGVWCADDFHPSTDVERDRYASTIMDKRALRLLGSVALARAARGEDDVAAISVLKLLGLPRG
ncbi:hypothetical protein A5695_07035 [Mycobacterium sp. E1747]|nr:hypothetical protein A5695_07035 [Mycobacterium sp. E1747]